tara:strand:- start:348 stop:1151 length:804 start_codon:yes stop_codon:yes gene_type:complete
MKKQKIYFITYGDEKFKLSKKHLIGLAKYSGLFEECISFGPKDLDREFVKKYKNILNFERGGGYWIWKHYLLGKILNEIDKNDVVIYCDAGASFNYKAKKRFLEYIEILNNSEFGNLRIECEKIHIEKNWTSNELFNYFEIDKNSDIGSSTQLQGGHIFLKNNSHSNLFINEFKNTIDFDENLITDFYNNQNQADYFIENRHDQSIFSLITKKYGGEIIENETIFEKGSENQLNFPFLSVRKGGHGLRDRILFRYRYPRLRKQPIYF